MARSASQDNVPEPLSLADGACTIAEMWREVRRIPPAQLLDLVVPTAHAAADVWGSDASLEHKRRRLLFAEMVLHRVNFDLMGLKRDPAADLAAAVPELFFKPQS